MSALILCILIVLFPISGLCSPPISAQALRVIASKHEIHVQATAHPDQFQGPTTKKTHAMAYHLLVWDRGRAASSALFTTAVSDGALHDALLQLGASPGNALNIETWDQRHNPNHSAPDQHVTGTPIDIDILWPDGVSAQPISELLTDPGGRGFDFRFGGHLANQAAWHSGCGVCLYSCPGGKISNAAYTVRDFVEKDTHFRLRPDVPLKDNTRVTLIFRIKKTGSAIPTGEK